MQSPNSRSSPLGKWATWPPDVPLPGLSPASASAGWAVTGPEHAPWALHNHPAASRPRACLRLPLLENAAFADRLFAPGFLYLVQLYTHYATTLREFSAEKEK